MKFNSDIHHRRSIRLRNYDYSQEGAYFITVCTRNRECLFGEVLEEKMRINNMGCIAQNCWKAIPNHFGPAELDEYVIMPNHLHGIVVITRNHLRRGDACVAPTETDGVQWALRNGPQPGSVGAIIGSFKSAVTKYVNRISGRLGISIWQRNYHEHVIRDDEELLRVRQYIQDNPLQWALDENNPNNYKNQNVNTVCRGDACVAPTIDEVLP